MYEQQYDRCMVLPNRFDLSLSSVRFLNGNPVQPLRQEIGAGPCERINYAREIEKIIALQQAVQFVRGSSEKLEFNASDCVICKKAR